LTELLIQGGTVYGPDGPREADVYINDGVILRVEAGATAPDTAARIDARGMYVLPGAIDAHVHSRDPGFPDKEDFGTLTEAAAVGGVTTVLDMPNTVPGVDSAGVLETKAALAHAKSRVDFGLWGLIRSSSTADQLEALADAGAIGFKAYLGYAFSVGHKRVMQTADLDDPDLEAPPDYGTLARLAPVVAQLGLPLAIHAEDPTVLAAFRRPLETYTDLLESRPAEAESVAISAAAAIAKDSGAHLHVAHLSSALGLRAAEDAMRNGVSLTLETCPQYLWLTEADFLLVGTSMKVFPPIRTPWSRQPRAA
jgi:dihydroorotase